jgi:hypothetical protein
MHISFVMKCLKSYFKILLGFTFALTSVISSPALAVPEQPLVTCIHLISGKERISKSGTCRNSQEAHLNWHVAHIKTIGEKNELPSRKVICSNKEESPVTYRIIRSSCARHMQENVYTRSKAAPMQPVVAEAKSLSHESVTFILESDPGVSQDAPVAYFTVTSDRGDTKKVYYWRELTFSINGLHSSTTYSFTISATNADGTSKVSAETMPITTRAYVPPAPPSDPAPRAYSVGETGPGGGIVFYAASTPFTCGPTLNLSCKYLEAAPTTGTDAWTDAIYWWSDVFTEIGTTGTAIGTGYSNTLAMNTQSSSSGIAGTRSQDFRGPNNLTDWFLPSRDELNEMYLSRDIIGDLTSNYYWSSSEFNAAVGMDHGLGDGNQTLDYKNENYVYVRPIRAF